ncbi:enoyl-CoA hydratase family protein [Branchiibius cervicis]|uniref:Enoyl-CoA hydratase family protein n=1 Tax=Branchiibius cervicis TaxID=908252 RepID=A0ABW2AXP2_9MICO
MSEELVHYEVADGIATITLDSPHNRNALSDPLVESLNSALQQADSAVDVRVVVLTHSGGTFCAGADLSSASSLPPGADPVTARGQALADLLRAMLSLGKPIVGRLDGHVRAGGMGLVGACDIVVAGPRTTFALTEARLGLAPSVISLTVLPRLTSRDAADLALTGRVLTALEGAERGWVTHAVPDSADVDGATRGVLTDLLKCSPQGLAETKLLLNRSLLQRFDANREIVVEQSARLFASEEAREGMAAFLEKRPPRWAR